jgi:hypothetical protein
MLPRDTSLAAHAAQIAWLRRLTPAARVELAVQMSEDTRALARMGIATRHPEYTPEERTLALWRLLLGDELFQRAWPRAPLLAP